MQTSESIKNLVQDKYGQIASQSSNGCGCGSGCCGEEIDYSVMAKDYSALDGYVESADLKLGCGLPIEHANITTGSTVVDLGSGAGNDVFIARRIVGESGRVIGIDMTPEMVEKARTNNKTIGYENVEFHLGDIEKLPLENAVADIVVSNCVLNLVPDKALAFSEVYRILKPGGHFCISDIVLNGELPEQTKKQAELYVGCVAGALQEKDYLDIIHNAGFKDVDVKVRQENKIPDSTLATVLSVAEIKEFKNSDVGIFSITVVGRK
jgi:arsenite methyltransferase